MANTFKFGNGNWAVKDGYALAYNDENNNFKPLPFDFTRASSATTLNRQGLIETVPSGKPRIDFLNNTSGHLLLEPSRTNSLLQSNQFDTTWYNSNSNESVSSGGFGGLNYWTITKTAASGWIRQNLSLSGVQTLSVFAKSGTLNWIRIIATGSSTASTWFDLQNGVVGSADFNTESSSIESVGDGWYRCSITVDIGTVNGVRFYPADGNNDISGTSGSILIQAAQLEAGSYATSYIPTEGSSVTRVAETCNGAGNSTVFNDSEGVLFVEIQALADDGTSRRITVTDDSGANYNNIVSLELDESTNKLRGFVINNSGNITTVSTTNLNQDENNKIALKYNSASTNLYVNGSEVDSATSTNLPTGLVKLDFDSGRSDEIQDFYGKVKEIKVYNTALTDTELQNLTS